MIYVPPIRVVLPRSMSFKDFSESIEDEDVEIGSKRQI